MIDSLTEKQKIFCEEYLVNGYNGLKAYSKGFANDNDNACAVGAHELLRQPKINEYIKMLEGSYKILAMEHGIDRKFILRKIGEMLNATKKTYFNGVLIDESIDSIAVNNGITTFAKLTGEFEAEKKQIVFEDESFSKDPSKLSHEEREEFKKDILSKL